MLHNRIRNRNNRRFWLKIFSGQSFGRRKTYYFNNGNTCNRFAYKPNRKFNILKISLVIIFFIAFKLEFKNHSSRFPVLKIVLARVVILKFILAVF